MRENNRNKREKTISEILETKEEDLARKERLSKEPIIRIDPEDNYKDISVVYGKKSQGKLEWATIYSTKNDQFFANAKRKYFNKTYYYKKRKQCGKI